MFSAIEQRNNIYRDVSYNFDGNYSQQIENSNNDEPSNYSQNASSQQDKTLDKSEDGSNNND